MYYDEPNDVLILKAQSFCSYREKNSFPSFSYFRYDAARVMYGLTNFIRCRCGDDLSLVSADQFGSYIEIPGGNVRVPLGYVGVLAPLLRDLPSCCLK